MENIRFYSAYVHTNTKDPFLFELEELKVKKVYGDGTIELNSPYFIMDDYSTRYFGGRSGNAINCEYKLRHVRVFYSTDKNKCMDYLNKNRADLVEYCNKLLERLQESKITTKYLED